MEPHAFRQAGVPHPGQDRVFFEEALRELALRLRRPPLEIRGFRQRVPEHSERAWRVVCTVRGRQTTPVCDDTEFEVVDRSWEDGLLRVMQLAIARMSHNFADRLQDSPFRFYGRRDDHGRMSPADPHPQFADYASHSEYLLQHTQRQLDHIRSRYDMKTMDC
jgi:hypothetical protein